MNAKEKVSRFSKDFKAFAMKGDVWQLAIGVMIGGAFSKIVSSLVSDMLMPLIGLATGGIDLTSLYFTLDGHAYPTLESAKAAGAATVNYGTFMQTVIDFLIISLCIFVFMRILERLFHKHAAREEAKPAPVCPFCRMEIKPEATRCPHCTSQLDV